MATRDKSKLPAEEKAHVHQWMMDPDGKSYRCLALYKGKPCQMIKINPKEYELRLEEWNDYYKQVHNSDSYRDWLEMKTAFKFNDKAKMDEVLERVQKRCWIVEGQTNEWGDNLFAFKEGEYMAKPNFPDPVKPWSYFIETDNK